MTKIVFLILLSPIILFYNLSIHENKQKYKNVEGVEKIKILYTLAQNYMTTNLDSTLYYAKKSMELATHMDCDTLAANSAYLIGRAFILDEQYDKAKKYSLYSMRISSSNNNIEKYMLSLIDLGIINYNLSDFNQALIYYKKLLSISKNIDNKEWYAIALDGIGTTYSLKGDYELANYYLNSSLKEYNKLKMDETTARLLYGIGAVYMATTHYDQALDNFLRSIKISDEKNQLDYLAMGNHAIGVIYEKLKNYTMALKYYKIALEIAENIKDKYLIGSFLNDSGELYLHISQHDKALEISNRALLVQEKISNKIGIAHAYDLKGSIYLKANQYNKALKNFKQAKKILENVDQKYRQTKILNHLGVVYTKIAQYDVAKKYLHQSLDDAKRIGAQDLVMESLTALSNYYANVHDYRKAFQYLAEFTQLNDSIFTTSSNHIAEMQMRYETGKREKENEILKNKIEIQNLELEKSNLKNWISYLSLAIVSIVGFFSYNRYKVKRRANILLEQKVQDAVKKHQEQQEIIFHQANLSSLGELAAGMAHEINQPLQAIKLSTESLDLDIRKLKIENSMMKENISEIYQSIDRAKSIIDHVRIFASQQKNSVKEYFKPTSVVENAFSLIGKQYLKKEIFFKLRLNKRVGKIKGNPYKYEQIVFNLISNAKDALLEKEKRLNQSFRKEIEIRIYRDKNELVLFIKDNGIGMNKEQKDNIFSPFYTTKNLGEGTGLGLSIVFGLVKEMNGRILVTSDYTSGTSVEVRIPKAKVIKQVNNSSHVF
jgi:C4-dicarboxylate-specific signal transduction histidine kinase